MLCVMLYTLGLYIHHIFSVLYLDSAPMIVCFRMQLRGHASISDTWNSSELKGKKDHNLSFRKGIYIIMHVCMYERTKGEVGDIISSLQLLIF